MGIKSFFKKVGSGLKKAGRWVKNKAIPFIGRLAKPILHGISLLPGKLGLIGKLGSAVTGIAGGIVDKIPNDKVRGRMNEWIEHEARIGQDKLHKITDIAQRANDAINTVRDGYNNQVKPILKQTVS